MTKADRFLMFMFAVLLLVFFAMFLESWLKSRERPCQQVYSPQGTAVLGYSP